MDALPSDKKKLIAYCVVIALCIGGGVYAYVSLSGDSSGPKTEAEVRLDEITAKMTEAQPPAPPPPPIPTARRGAVAAPGK